MAGARRVRVPRGTRPSAHGWPREAGLRRVRNTLDPQVGELVYGGTGRAAREWASCDARVRTRTELRGGEMMLLQSGRTVGVLCAPEVAAERGVRVPRREDSADDAPAAEAVSEEGAA